MGLQTLCIEHQRRREGDGCLTLGLQKHSLNAAVWLPDRHRSSSGKVY